jgi:hypothetical protein
MNTSNLWLRTGLSVGASLTALAFVLLLGACSSTPADMPDMTRDLTFFSCCGQPGDPGDNLAIGKFCRVTLDCPQSPIHFCSADQLPQKHSYFCTIPCSSTSDTTTCGASAKCLFNPDLQGYGCVPTTCINNLPPGCSL